MGDEKSGGNSGRSAEYGANLARGPGRRLKQFLALRFPRPYTFSTQCQAFGFDEDVVNKWINGEEFISDDGALRLIQLGCDITWFLEGIEDNMPPISENTKDILLEYDSGIITLLEQSFSVRRQLLEVQTRLLSDEQQSEESLDRRPLHLRRASDSVLKLGELLESLANRLESGGEDGA